VTLKCIGVTPEGELDVVLAGADAGVETSLAKLTSGFERGMTKGEPTFRRAGAPQAVTCAGGHSGLELRGSYTDLGTVYFTRLCTFLQSGRVFWVNASTPADDAGDGATSEQALIASAHYH